MASEGVCVYFRCLTGRLSPKRSLECMGQLIRDQSFESTMVKIFVGEPLGCSTKIIR